MPLKSNIIRSGVTKETLTSVILCSVGSDLLVLSPPASAPIERTHCSIQVNVWKIIYLNCAEWKVYHGSQRLFMRGFRFRVFKLTRPLVWKTTKPGGGVLPYKGYIGMCGPEGYGFSAVLVINRVSILANYGHFGHKLGLVFVLQPWCGYLFKPRNHVFIIIEKKINKSPS